MESSCDVLSDSLDNAGADTALSAPPLRLALPPKGACWYCDRPLDNVRRFCGKDCAGAYDEEARFSDIV